MCPPLLIFLLLLVFLPGEHIVKYVYLILHANGFTHYALHILFVDGQQSFPKIPVAVLAHILQGPRKVSYGDGPLTKRLIALQIFEKRGLLILRHSGAQVGGYALVVLKLPVCDSMIVLTHGVILLRHLS